RSGNGPEPYLRGSVGGSLSTVRGTLVGRVRPGGQHGISGRGSAAPRGRLGSGHSVDRVGPGPGRPLVGGRAVVWHSAGAVPGRAGGAQRGVGGGLLVGEWEEEEPGRCIRRGMPTITAPME